MDKPLTKPEFIDALHKGKGRALMHIRQFGDEGLRDLLLDACLHNIGYDKQLEDRGSWMIEMIQATAQPDYYFCAVMAEYLANTNWHDTCQLIDIIDWLAIRGNASAKALLYEKYKLQQLDEWGMSCIGKRLVALDGIAALLFAADISGRRLQTDSTHREQNWLIDYACEKLDEENVLNALEAEAALNPAIKTYMDKVLEVSGAFRENKNVEYVSKPQPTTTLQEWLAQIETLNPDSKRHVFRSLSFRFAREATEAEVIILFEYMLQETRKEQLVRYLWGFSKREMPRLEPSVLKLVESEDTTIRNAAISALAFVFHDDVRTLAIQLLESGNLDGLELLQYNWREGDYPVIEALLFIPSDEAILHSATSNLIDIYDANESPGAVGCLLWVYENTPCSMCREMAVKRLVELNALPLKLKHECRYDCSEHTRTEVKKI